jgi:hypothetical protein
MSEELTKDVAKVKAMPNQQVAHANQYGAVKST